MRALATPQGVISALAVDQRGSLRTMIAKASGGGVTDTALSEFKTAVSKVLSPHVSAILIDSEFGGAAIQAKAADCGLLSTYEMDGYENPRPHRMLALMLELSVLRIREMGGQAVKILLSWAPDDDATANDTKKVLIERIGAECETLDMPFFLEPVVYDPAGFDPQSEAWARRKPRLVIRTMEEFSQPRYRVDVLKVEFPLSARFVGPVIEKAAALDLYREADAASKLPYIYLSAGVATEEFQASLELAAEAGARFSGVLCGRATWQGGVAEYARGGVSALEEWLSVHGMKNVRSIEQRLRTAASWERRLG